MAKHTRSKATSAPLAAAVATVSLSQTAQATTANEGDFGGDFGDDFASRTLLPIGTDVVNGNLGVSDADFITFQGLLPGGSFTLDATQDGAPGFIFVSEWDDGGSFLQSEDDNGTGTLVPLSGTIPGSGRLNFSISAEGGPNYTFTLTAPLPEPAVTALLGGGLLAAAALRRVRARRS